MIIDGNKKYVFKRVSLKYVNKRGKKVNLSGHTIVEVNTCDSCGKIRECSFLSGARICLQCIKRKAGAK